MAAAEAKTYEFFAGMTCAGCTGAVTRICNKIEGLTNVETSIEDKKVLVTGTMDPQLVLAKLTKWANASKKELRFVGEVQ
mmetsp:Transcript_19557/g.21862  ORF Transcript_19557/g.21862 Transcript_19557/m.21862 type:complete len:80 (+) Transcript_19557:30-269(+)|eukprot:CAMPEP_0205827192 /NCGR_PEP_ID=MMETSP0206-20130828/31205_1 /ASSEMBLY_ACC=CAM_ASM_000279 /TAXON_ID=36767 /ORGANISM="Euplotes focardii, Strain TN1" /LENGTH=79 /DNA_ID=CAMNT_0053127865 /DNA_START=26 /DNA_END=265 /DNA_ORIENTATION=+